MSDKEIRKKEGLLETLKVDDEIEGKRLDIARKKAEEAELKKQYGKDWKKYLGMLKPSRGDLFALNPELTKIKPDTSRLK